VFEFTHDDHEIVVGLNWQSATKKGDLSADWAETNNSDRSVIAKGTGRYSWGVVKHSKSNDELSKDCMSLAIIQALQYKSSAWVIELPKPDKNSAPQYWGCLISEGVPEFEVVNEDVKEVVRLLNELLDDEVENIISVDSPILFSYLPSINLEGCEGWEEFLLQRNWRQTNYEYDELSDLLLNSGFRSQARIGGASTGFDYRILLTRDAITKISFVLFLIVASGYFFGGFNKDELAPILQYASPVKNTGPVINIQDETRKIVSANIAGEILGINRKWALKNRAKFWELPSYSYGYRKSHMTCTLLQRRCEYTYKANENYSDLDKALDKLALYFEAVTFSTDGKNIFGGTSIQMEDLYTKQHTIEELPPFDSGREITSKSIMLSKSRPGLTMNTTNAELMQVDFKKKKISPDPTVATKYMIIGWAATGSYDHQVDTVLDNLTSKYISINSISIQTENGQTSFNLRGSYLMRDNNGK